ncbi:MAG: NFACT RNA binding domain-containing protein [Candidatus Pacearchaeota archaeon]
MYRWFYTSSGKLVIAGKNAEQNEEIMRNVRPEDIVLHTASAGSPFCVIRKPNAQDLKEAAIFCACFSQDWKRGKKKAEVHIFKGEQVYKEKSMQKGTFGVLGKVFRKKVELKLTLVFQKDEKGKPRLRAVPLSCYKHFCFLDKKNKIPKIVLKPGKIKKEEAAHRISLELAKCGQKISIEEILQAIPAGGFEICKG